ncbi:hypothetical protein B9T34_00595 [Acinetobacter sp. ANC 3813]|nr:hypothetical protein [Acinetobacter sp. ANC 3813]OTG91884.1 hypothetical protein B9T34_00595 [Acinetobacter sp. ANC 3813]
MILKNTLIASILLILAGCQSLPAPEQKAPEKNAQKENPKVIRDSSGVIIHPYDRPDIERKPVVIPKQPERVQKFDDGRNLPAFKKLIQQTQSFYAKGELNKAEDTAMQAQRLAPQSAETFMYLAMIANRKNQPANAEALAQRGLSYAQSTPMKKQLWNIMLQAGQKQKKTQTIQKAQQALKAL